MAIQVVVVWQYFVPILVISITGGVITTLLCVYYGTRLWNFKLERMLAIYGTVTGTVSSGLLLLRIVDPEFKTTVALETGVMLMFASPYIILGMLWVSAPVLWQWSLMKTILVFVGMFILAIVITEIQRYLILKKKKA
jgi:ESS family glutamate:Na+ symporter